MATGGRGTDARTKAAAPAGSSAAKATAETGTAGARIEPLTLPVNPEA